MGDVRSAAGSRSSDSAYASFTRSSARSPPSDLAAGAMKATGTPNGRGESANGNAGSGSTSAFDMAAFNRALPSSTPSGYGHGHSASMSSLPQHLNAPGNASGGHGHSRSVSHNRDAQVKAGNTAMSSGASTGPAGTPNVFDGSVRRGTCKFFNSQKGYGFINDARAHELNNEEGAFALAPRPRQLTPRTQSSSTTRPSRARAASGR